MFVCFFEVLPFPKEKNRTFVLEFRSSPLRSIKRERGLRPTAFKTRLRKRKSVTLIIYGQGEFKVNRERENRAKENIELKRVVESLHPTLVIK